jgi:hypothetical protein
LRSEKGEAIQKGKALALDCFARSNSGSLAMTGGPSAMTAGIVIANPKGEAIRKPQTAINHLEPQMNTHFCSTPFLFVSICGNL